MAPRVTSDKQHLANYLFAPNYYAKRKGEKVYDPKYLSPDERAELLARVTEALKPENLTCKFQLTGETLKLKTYMVEGAYRALGGK